MIEISMMSLTRMPANVLTSNSVRKVALRNEVSALRISARLLLLVYVQQTSNVAS
jgi:hypothetical protein